MYPTTFPVLVVFVVFMRFDLENKLPQMKEEVAARRAAQQKQE